MHSACSPYPSSHPERRPPHPENQSSRPTSDNKLGATVPFCISHEAPHSSSALLLPQNQHPATSQSSQERHPLETSPAADGAPENTCISVLFWLWKSQPQDTITSLEKSPKTVCPDWDTPQKQECSPHPELPEGSMLEWAELTQHLQPQLPSCCLLWQAPRNRAERGHIQHLTPPLCTAPARFKTRGLSLSSWQPFPRPWGHPSLPFS